MEKLVITTDQHDGTPCSLFLIFLDLAEQGQITPSQEALTLLAMTIGALNPTTEQVKRLLDRWVTFTD